MTSFFSEESFPMFRFRSFLPLAAVLVGAAILGAPTRAHAAFAPLRLDFSSTVGGGITFNPTDVTPPAGGTGSFLFGHGILPGQTGAAFQITNHVNNDTLGLGALGLLGDITGTYNIGPITTSGSVEQAVVVAGAGATHQFSITDAGGKVFLADVNWINIRTTGVGGVINADGQINLSNVTYVGGTNADLLQLYNQSLPPNGGIATISFQLASSASLTTLTSGPTPTTTSYSGSVSSVPAPPSLVLLFMGGMAIGLGRLVRLRKASVKAA